MNSHGRKKIAPVIVTILMLAYFAVYFGFLIFLVPFIMIKVLLGIVPLILGACMIAVCIQRIKEIDGGEEDDLGKY